MNNPIQKQHADDDDLYLDIEVDEAYSEMISEFIGLALHKRPSPKQRSQIVRELRTKIANEEDYDAEQLLLKYAQDCLEPLYLQGDKNFSWVTRIMSAFLSSEHTMFEQLDINNDPEPNHIKQILKKPSVDQVHAVVMALRAHDPNWAPWNGPKCVRRLANTFARSFPELIKDSAQARIFFGLAGSPKLKGKNKKNGHGIVTLAVMTIVLYALIKSCTN